MRSALERELGWRVEFHAVLPSTQDRALELADGSEGSGVVVADEQRAGRGTRGRPWLAPAGAALLASWLFRPAPAEPALTTVLAAVAVARALDAVGAGAGVALKWPNDVLVGGRKAAGVLAHARTDGRGGALVLGIGVNVHQRAADFPPEIAGSATSLHLAGTEVDRLALLVQLTAQLTRIASAAERRSALAEWRRRAPLLGRPVEVAREGEPPLRGRATALDDDGALVVETAYGPQRILAGEVTVREQ